MARPLTRPDRRIGVAALTLPALLAGGCYSNHVRTDPGAALAHSVDATLVTLADGSQVRVRGAFVRGDTLNGANAMDDSRVALPLERVRTVEVQEFSVARTSLAILGTAGVLLLVWVWIAVGVAAAH